MIQKVIATSYPNRTSDSDQVIQVSPSNIKDSIIQNTGGYERFNLFIASFKALSKVNHPLQNSLLLLKLISNNNQLYHTLFLNKFSDTIINTLFSDHLNNTQLNHLIQLFKYEPTHLETVDTMKKSLSSFESNSKINRFYYKELTTILKHIAQFKKDSSLIHQLFVYQEVIKAYVQFETSLSKSIKQIYSEHLKQQLKKQSPKRSGKKKKSSKNKKKKMIIGYPAISAIDILINNKKNKAIESFINLLIQLLNHLFKQQHPYLLPTIAPQSDKYAVIGSTITTVINDLVTQWKASYKKPFHIETALRQQSRTIDVQLCEGLDILNKFINALSIHQLNLFKQQPACNNVSYLEPFIVKHSQSYTKINHLISTKSYLKKSATECHQLLIFTKDFLTKLQSIDTNGHEQDSYYSHYHMFLSLTMLFLDTITKRFNYKTKLEQLQQSLNNPQLNHQHDYLENIICTQKSKQKLSKSKEIKQKLRADRIEKRQQTFKKAQQSFTKKVDLAIKETQQFLTHNCNTQNLKNLDPSEISTILDHLNQYQTWFNNRQDTVSKLLKSNQQDTISTILHKVTLAIKKITLIQKHLKRRLTQLSQLFIPIHQRTNDYRNTLLSLASHEYVKDIISELYRPKGYTTTVYFDGGTASGLVHEAETGHFLSERSHYWKSLIFYDYISDLMSNYESLFDYADYQLLSYLITDLEVATTLFTDHYNPNTLQPNQ
ncbi:hypothetical protein DID75_05765 [Candidatus Marinamargulisbacteria bacterium SCGC AG-410-N11]|nr:hypothetical protein DID75_05765 [Candidatus Marinamargulisbacteria bacterium SCGC AG-410-N11]